MTEARGGKRSNKKQPPLYNEVGLANHFKTAEAPMDDLSLAHSRYNCTYHIVFIPKYRRKVMFGELRKEIGEIIGKVCKMEIESRLSKRPPCLIMYICMCRSHRK